MAEWVQSPSPALGGHEIRRSWVRTLIESNQWHRNLYSSLSSLAFWHYLDRARSSGTRKTNRPQLKNLSCLRYNKKQPEKTLNDKPTSAMDLAWRQSFFITHQERLNLRHWVLAPNNIYIRRSGRMSWATAACFGRQWDFNPDRVKQITFKCIPVATQLGARHY